MSVGFCVSGAVTNPRRTRSGYLTVLLAYLDEIGETGAFVSRTDHRYKTSPAFGYAGFVIDAERAREFGQAFVEGKRQLFHTEMDAAEHPGRWERKGSQLFRATTLQRYPEQFRVFRALVRSCRSLGGQLFYYADEKPVGTPGQTRLDPTAREAAAMRETLNRIARHAESKATTVLVMLDQITEKTRSERLPNMYGHVYARSTDYPEMKRIVEPPMHVDSALSSTIQFADWVAAFVSRALDYQLLVDSPHGWVVTTKWLDYARGRAGLPTSRSCTCTSGQSTTCTGQTSSRSTAGFTRNQTDSGWARASTPTSRKRYAASPTPGSDDETTELAVTTICRRRSRG